MKKKILLVIAQVLLLAVAGGVTWWFAQPEPPAVEEADSPEAVAATVKPPVYYGIHPPFIVNLMDSRTMRFLQIEVEIMARDAAVVEQVKQYLPRIRNDLIMLFSRLNKDDATNPDIRQSIQDNARDVINVVIREEGGQGNVEAVYFTKFVMQ